MNALNDAGIPTMGPTFASGEGELEPPTVGHLMLAVVEAASAGQAAWRVSHALPSEGNYTIEGVAELSLGG